MKKKINTNLLIREREPWLAANEYELVDCGLRLHTIDTWYTHSRAHKTSLCIEVRTLWSIAQCQNIILYKPQISNFITMWDTKTPWIITSNLKWLVVLESDTGSFTACLHNWLTPTFLHKISLSKRAGITVTANGVLLKDCINYGWTTNGIHNKQIQFYTREQKIISTWGIPHCAWELIGLKRPQIEVFYGWRR